MTLGRPPFEITEEVCKKAKSLAAQGMNLEQIANCLGIHYDTLNEKKKEFSEFSESIKEGQAQGIGIITSKLFGRGKGVTLSKTVTVEKDGKSESTTTTTDILPDVTAQIFYLKNRAGWTDRSEIDHSIGLGHNGGVSRASGILDGFKSRRSDDSDAGTVPE